MWRQTRRDVGLPYRSLKAYRNVFRMVTPVRAPLDARVPPQPRLIVAELYKSPEDTLSSAINSSNYGQSTALREFSSLEG